MYLFINYLYAEGSASAQQGFDIRSFIPFVLIFTVFYFLLIRPQQKRESSRKKLLEAVKSGDRIVTSSGIIAKFAETISETEVSIEVSKGIFLNILKSHIVDFPQKNVENKTETMDEIKKKIKKQRSSTETSEKEILSGEDKTTEK